MRRILLLLCASIAATTVYALPPNQNVSKTFYWNFTHQAALPPSWVNSRAACTGSVTACVTNAQYNDAAGAAYTTYAATHSAFTSQGTGIFEGRTNYLFPSDTPVTTTTGSVPLGYYVLMCNGSGSVTSSAGTGVATGLGALTCSSTYQTVQVTTAGTFIFTVSGTVNWFDFQGPCNYANSACGPTTHIVTTIGTSSRPSDVVKIGAAQSAFMGLRNSSAVLEYYSTSSGSSNQIAVLGGPSGTFALFPIDASNSSHCTSGIQGILNGATSGSNQAILTLNRVAGTNYPTNYALSCNGAASTNSSSASVPTAAVYYLGSISNGNFCNCWVSQIKLFPFVLPTTLLQQYSSAGAAF